MSDFKLYGQTQINQTILCLNAHFKALKTNLNFTLNYNLMNSQIMHYNKKILQVTLEIKGDYPELSKYIEEMPVTIPNDADPQINLKSLDDYLDSLNELINKYEEDCLLKSNQI